MRITTYNVRGVRGKEKTITKLMEHTDILGLSETWINGDKIDYSTQMNLAVNNKTSNKNNRSFGGVAMIINPIIKFKIIREMAHPKYQFITIGLTNLTVTVCYISPSASAGTVEGAMVEIQRHTGDRAIVMGDFNARHKQWDDTTNSRGIVIKRCSIKREWQIQKSAEMTCYAARGCSKPDLFLRRGVRTSTV